MILEPRRAGTWILGLLLLAGPALAPAVGGQADGSAPQVPGDLPERMERLERALVNVSEAQRLEHARVAHGDVAALEPRVVPYVQGLDPVAGAILADHLAAIARALDAGNASAAREEAQGAAELVRGRVQPVVDAWALDGTAVALGSVRWRSASEIVVPVLLIDPPDGGLGSLTVDVETDTDRVQLVDASTRGEDGTATRVGDGEVRLNAAGATLQAGGDGDRSIVVGEVVFGGQDVVAGTVLPANLSVTEATRPSGEGQLALALPDEPTVPPRAAAWDTWSDLWWAGLLAVGAMLAVSGLVTWRWMRTGPDG